MSDYFQSIFSTKASILLGVVVIGCVVLITFYPMLGTGLWGSDFMFLERAGKTPFFEYMSQASFARFGGPARVTRPLFGLLAWIEYHLFRSNASAYHAVSGCIHLLNSLLIFGLVGQIGGQKRVGIIAALLFACLPLTSFAVWWFSDVSEPAVTLLYLIAVSCWFMFLQTGKGRFYLFALLTFVAALEMKETAVSLPIVLFLGELLLFHSKMDWAGWLRRYALFILLWLAFLMQFPDHAGRLSMELGGVLNLTISNLLRYLVWLIFPWSPAEWIDNYWVWGAAILAGLVFSYIVIVTRNMRLLFMALGALVALSPFLPFWEFGPRFLYLPVVFSIILWAWLFEVGWKILRRQSNFAWLAMLIFSVILWLNSTAVANATAEFAALSRLDRLAFRNISQSHPTFQKGTYLYLIDPPTPSVHLSGMFFLRYGTDVTVASTYLNEVARLRDFPYAYVYYFDETGAVIEVVADKEVKSSAVPALPINFQAAIRLDGYQVTQSTLRRGDALVLFLYWRAVGQIEKDYTVFVHLVNDKGNTVTGYDSQPRSAKSPTTTWKPGILIVDPVVIRVPADASTGSNYHLEVGLYHLPTMERLPIVDEALHPVTDKVVIEPLEIVE